MSDSLLEAMLREQAAQKAAAAPPPASVDPGPQAEDPGVTAMRATAHRLTTMAAGEMRERAMLIARCAVRLGEVRQAVAQFGCPELAAETEALIAKFADEEQRLRGLRSN